MEAISPEADDALDAGRSELERELALADVHSADRRKFSGRASGPLTR
jgi:hypothetical protein